MSLNGPKSNAVNKAVNAAVDKVIYKVYLVHLVTDFFQGTVVVVSAGNSGDDACNNSPASATKASVQLQPYNIIIIYKLITLSSVWLWLPAAISINLHSTAVVADVLP